MRFVRSLTPAVMAASLAVAAPAAAHDGQFHGDPREALPDSLVVQPVEQRELAGTERTTAVAAELQLPETWCGTPTGTDDTANQVSPASVPQIKLVYAYASDQPNRFAQLADRLQANVSLLGRYLAQQSGGRKALRWDMGTSCGPEYVDIQIVQLPKTRSQYVVSGAPQFLTVVNDVEAIVGSQPGPRNWAIYADGFYGTNGVAGTAWRLESDSPATTAHDQGRLESVVFGPQTLPSSGYVWPSVMLHEITHNLGAVQNAAPHTTGNGHCNDRYDVMCYPDGGPTSSPTYPCPKIGGVVDETFDCNGDDYFNPTPAAGSYLATHWNVFSSAHLGPCASELAVACGLPPGGGEPDTTAPQNTTPSAPTGWAAGTYTVGLTGSDTQSVVDAWAWQVDGGPEHSGATATVSGDGVHALRTRVRDSAGNWSAWREETVRIDGTSPAVSLTCNGTASVSCSGTGLDAHSGVDRVEMRAGSGPLVVGAGASLSLQVAEAGETVVRARVRDAAGNWSEWASTVVTIQAVAPFSPIRLPVQPAGDDDDPDLVDGAALPRAASALLVDAQGRRRAGAQVEVERGRATLAVTPGRLARGTWRVKACVAGRCVVRTIRLRRARSPRAIRGVVPAGSGRVEAIFALERRVRGRFRTVARGAAAA